MPDDPAKPAPAAPVGPLLPPVTPATVDVAIDEVLERADENPSIDESPRLPSAIARVLGVTRIGVFTGHSSLGSTAAMRRDVDFCVAHGISHLSIMVNDHSASRSPRAFNTYDRAAIIQLSRMAIAAKLDVHLISWLMPHEAYIRTAAAQLVPMAREAGARALEFDVEEPWTQATNPMDYIKAADLVRTLLESTRFGVSGIGYTPADKFGPLAEVADFVIPQIYCTATSKVDPDTDVELFAKRYRDLFGHNTTIVGLAAYGQEGIPGHTIDSALRAAFKHTSALSYVRQVTYWSLSWIRSSPTVAAMIKLLSGTKIERPKITASVGRGGKNVTEDVAVVQRLLLAHGYDIGLADGIVGARTIFAIEAFQRSIGFPKPDGRIDPDGRTFASLVGA